MSTPTHTWPFSPTVRFFIGFVSGCLSALVGVLIVLAVLFAFHQAFPRISSLVTVVAIPGAFAGARAVNEKKGGDPLRLGIGMLRENS